jgi:hypothetical protein
MRLDALLPKRRAWLLCLLLPLTAGAGTPADYAYRYTLDTVGSSAAWRVELTPAVYAASTPAANLRDLVVVNAQGQEVPFAPLPAAPPRSHPFALRATLLPLPSGSAGNGTGVRVQRNSNGDIVIEQPDMPSAPTRPSQWLVDARRQVSLDRIEIDPAALPVDSRFHLSVQASNDLQAWSERSEDTEIVSVKRGGDTVEQHTIALRGATPARYYRLSLRQNDVTPWDSAQTPQVELRGSYADPLAERMAARRWLTLPAAPVAPATSGGADYDYALPAALPVEAVRVVLGGDNTVARFSLLDHDEGNGRMLATITAVRIGTGADEDPATPFATTRVQHLRLHTDTPLSQPPSLQVAWRPDVFVFLAEGSGPYSLLAGSHAARRGDYPLEAALDRLRPRDAGADWQAPLATLGAVSDAGGAAALLAPKTPFDWTRLLLWLVLIGGALAVAGMAWSLLRQSRREDDTR